MSAISERREAMRAALVAAGVSAFSTKPERVTPPFAFVGPGDPYLTTEGATFGSEILQLEVVVVVRPGVSDTRADELDEMILVAFDAATNADFAVRDVGRPGQISLGGQAHIAAVLIAETEINRS